MIKTGIVPVCRIMAQIALRRIIARDVIGIGGAFEILLMAGIAGRRGSGIDPIRMAVGATGRHMCSGE